MMKQRRSYRKIGQIAMAGLLTGLGVYANAGDLSLEDNVLIITGSGASADFEASPFIEANGIVDNIDDVPVAESLGMPDFSFTLLKSGALEDGEYNFRIAITFQDNDSDRRLEAMIPDLVLQVSDGGDIINGEIPAGQSMLLLGRQNDLATVRAEIENSEINGPVTVADGEVRLNASKLLLSILNKHSAFADVINSFNNAAHYTYRIVVQQHALDQPETLRFGTDDAPFTPFPRIQTTCAENVNSESGSVFILNPVDDDEPGELAEYFTSAYAVQGQFSIVDSEGEFDVLEAFTESCTAGGGGGGDDEEPPAPDPDDGEGAADDEVDAELDDIGGDLDALEDLFAGELTEDEIIAALELLDASLDALDKLAEDALDQLLSGDLSDDAAIGILESTNDALAAFSKIADADGEVDAAAFAASLDNMAAMLGLISSSGDDGPTEAQKAQIESVVTGALASLVDVVDSTLSNDALNNLTESASTMLNALINNDGGAVSAEVKELAQNVVNQTTTALLTNALEDLGVNLGGLSQTETQELLRTNVALLETILSASVELKSTNSTETIAQLTTQLETAFVGLDISAEEVSGILESLSSNVINLNNFGAGTNSPLGALSAIFGAGSGNRASEAITGGFQTFFATETVGVSVDPVTGAVRIVDTSGTYSASITGVKVVSNLVPPGVNALPDGRFIAVNNGYAIELSGTASNLLGFVAAASNATQGVSFRDNGSFSLNLGANERFSGVFGYDNLAAFSSTCGAVTFQQPAGALNAPGYSFLAKCANGATQRIVPFVDASAFYDVLSAAKLTVTTDRNSGVITIATAGRFKPSFFVSPLKTADQAYFDANKNASGIAFRSKDVNRDGKADFEVMTTTGVQVLYGI